MDFPLWKPTQLRPRAERKAQGRAATRRQPAGLRGERQQVRRHTVLLLLAAAPLLLLLLVPLVALVLDLPTVLPPAVAGLALLIAFGRRGLLGSTLDVLGIQIAFTRLAVIMAQMFVAAPYYIKTGALGLAGVNGELEHSTARTRGRFFVM